MATTTGTGIIDSAGLKVGIETFTTAKYAQALTSLHNMMSLLGADLHTYVVTSESFSVDSGDGEYTMGSGGDWDTVRPSRIRSCFLRNSDNYDFPVRVISSKKYNWMPNKSLPG